MRPQAPLIVHKFGGAALADAAAIANVGVLLAAEGPQRRVVVTSALQGTTDQLIAAIARAAGGDAAGARAMSQEICAQHVRVATELSDAWPAGSRDVLRATIDAACDELDVQLDAFGKDASMTAMLSDAVLAFGERTAAEIVRAMLAAAGTSSVVVDGALLIETDGRHGDAAPDLVRTDARARTVLREYLDRDQTVVVPGFIGQGNEGAVVTLGRGGSDLTAAVLARALGAAEVVLWKDVAGLMTADPRIAPDARVVAMLDAREASELAYYGAKVLHPRTLLPLRAGMTLRLRPFADPAAGGTTIVVGRQTSGAPVRAISGIGHQAMVAVSGTGMLGVPGVAARVFGALAAAQISVSMISQASSEQSICFTIPAARADEVAALLREAFAHELDRGEVDEITVRAPLTTVAVVGSGMARTPGIAARIFDAVAHAQVNVVAIAQGSSERNVSFVVDEAQAPDAIRAVHRAFRLDKLGGGRVSRRAGQTDVIVLGVGRVAREFLAQLAQVSHRDTAPVRVVGLIDRRGYVFRSRGLTPRQLDRIIALKERGGTLDEAYGGARASAHAAVEIMASHALARPVLVDLASGDTSPALASAVLHDMHLVLANKVPLASSMQSASGILHGARARGRRVLHEATVGAGLPVIDTLQQLHASGDRVDSVDSSPSGTMGFLFSEMGRGRSFSAAVLDAMSRGYTEPDPRDDLCGLDVARKGLILARMLGYTGEMSDVAVESLVPVALSDVTAAQFIAALPGLDAEWAQRIEDANERGEVLRYRARSTRSGVRVGLVRSPVGSALASLDGTDNLFVFTTARYRDRPLVISGPGAGTEVTAAGVLGDVLRLVGSS